MLVLVTNRKRNTYRYRHKLFNSGLRFENGKWRLQTSDSKTIQDICYFCRRKHLAYELIEDQYVRSSDYRRNFINVYVKKAGKYFRCAYCGKKLTENQMTVDHIIPIDKVQHHSRYRLLMRLTGITNINDVNNLAPACERCNKRKGRRLHGYFLNGITGKTYSGVQKRRALKAILFAIILGGLFLLVYWLFNTEYVQTVLMEQLKQMKGILRIFH